MVPTTAIFFTVGTGQSASRPSRSSQWSMETDLIYTWGTMAHTSGKNPYGLNVLWGDGHVKFSTTKAAFDPKLWGGTGPNPTSETPGDNETKWRTIVSLLRP